MGKNSRTLTPAPSEPHLGWAIAFALLTALFTSLAQFAFKLSSSELDLARPWAFLMNWKFGVGILNYFVSLVTILSAYRYGQLTVVFPLVSLCYALNAFLGYFFLGEMLTPARILGTALIVLGAIVISR